MVWVPKVAQNTMLTVQQGQKAPLWRNLRPASRAKPWASLHRASGLRRTPAPVRAALPPRLPTAPPLWGPLGSSAVPQPRSGCGTAGASKSAARGVGGLPSTFAFALWRARGEWRPCGAKGVPETASYSCCWGIWVCKGCRRGERWAAEDNHR